jgi:hypothetical protein
VADTYGGGTAADWATFLTGLYNAHKKGSFKQVPMSPQQTGIFNWAYGNLQNTPNSSQALYPIAAHYVSNPSSIDVAALKRGDVGYHPGAPLSASDLAGVINPKPSGATAGPSSVGGPVSPTSSFTPGDLGSASRDPNDGKRLPNMAPPPDGRSPGSLISTPQPFDPNMQGRPGITSPAGENPNIVDIHNRNDPGYGSPSGTIPFDKSLGDIYGKTIGTPAGQSFWSQFTASHPNWMKDATSAAAAVAAFFSIPVAIALKIVSSLIPSHTGTTTPTQPTPPPSGGGTTTGPESTIAQASGLKNVISAQPRYMQAQRPGFRDLSAGNY